MTELVREAKSGRQEHARQRKNNETFYQSTIPDDVNHAREDAEGVNGLQPLLNWIN